VEDDERRAVARREGRYGLEDTVFRSGSFPAAQRSEGKGVEVSKIQSQQVNNNSRGISSKEVVARLLGGELRHGRQHAERVAREHDDVLRRALNEARDARIGDELDRVRAPRVLRDRHVFVVGLAVRDVEHDVLEDGPEPDRVVDLRLLLRRQVDALGVAPALDVVDARVGPHVLVVTDQLSSRVGRERSLARAGEPEEEGDIALLLVDVGGGVERELAEFDGHKVVHNGEDPLLHLSSVLGTENNHLHTLEVDLDGCVRRHAGRETVRGELAGVVDDKVGLAELLELLLSRADEHVVHEEGVVGSCADHSDLDAVFGIPLDGNEDHTKA
jgi:hypothetical protein